MEKIFNDTTKEISNSPKEQKVYEQEEEIEKKECKRID